MPDWLLLYAATIPVTALGGLARGIAGFGGPFVMLPVFNLFYPPTTSILIVLTVNILANIKLMPDAWRRQTSRTGIPLALGTVPFLPLGSYILLAVEPETARLIINAVILACALLLLTGWRYTRPIGWPGYATVGALGGVILGATSIAVPVALFLQSGRDSAAQGRANFIIWAFYASVFVIAYTWFGAEHDIPDPWLFLILLPVYFLGLISGFKLYKRMGDATLRRIIILFVLLVTSVGLIAEVLQITGRV
ncbi:MAG: sulfite exporter TauE/SafE family protein [Rhodospirillales bacterium]